MNIKSATHVQILNETVCISLCANALGEGMNPSVLLLAKGKYQGKLSSFVLVRQPVLKEKSELKLDIHFLKYSL